MTTVKLEIQGSYYHLLIDGHANFAELGNDIVCAGVSTLAYTLINCLDSLEKQGKLKHKVLEVDGSLEFLIPYTCEEAAIILNAIMIGLKMLSEHYPEHVQIGVPPEKMNCDISK